MSNMWTRILIPHADLTGELNGVAEEVRTSGVGVQGGSAGLEQSQKLTLNPASLAIRNIGHL